MVKIINVLKRVFNKNKYAVINKKNKHIIKSFKDIKQAKDFVEKEKDTFLYDGIEIVYTRL